MERFIAIIFALFFLQVPVFAQMIGTNDTVFFRYRPPDIYIPHGRTIKLEKVDINKANLQQLMALPEINESLALKIMRRRPVKYLNELERLPYMNMDRMKLILKGLQHMVVQRFEEEKTLKQ